MSNSISQTIIAALDNEQLQGLASQLGLSEEQVKEGVGQAVPSLLGFLSAKEQTLSPFLGFLDKDNDGSILDDLMGMLGGGNGSPLGSLVEQFSGSLGSALSDSSSLDSGNLQKLIQQLFPMVFGELKKVQLTEGIDRAELFSRLNTEREQAAGLNSGMAALLDRDGDGEITDDIAAAGMALLGSLGLGSSDK